MKTIEVRVVVEDHVDPEGLLDTLIRTVPTLLGANLLANGKPRDGLIFTAAGSREEAEQIAKLLAADSDSTLSKADPQIGIGDATLDS